MSAILMHELFMFSILFHKKSDTLVHVTLDLLYMDTDHNYYDTCLLSNDGTMLLLFSLYNI